MNEIRHITREEWTELFTAKAGTAEWMRLQSRIMAHVNECGECRALYERASDVRRAAEALAAAETAEAGEEAFRKVASSGGWAQKAADAGTLSVCVDAEGPAFLEDTLEASGAAEKYAMNLEDDRSLIDDGGALRLIIEDGCLNARLEEKGTKCVLRLLTEDGDIEKTLEGDGSEVSLALPKAGFCTVEMIFEETAE